MTLSVNHVQTAVSPECAHGTLVVVVRAITPFAKAASSACAGAVSRQRGGKMADSLSVGINLDAFAHAINAIQQLRSSVTRVFDTLKDGMKNKETLEGREKAFISDFQDNLHAVNRDLK